MAKTVVSYIRVSTARQGRSGLGLEAQREAIARFCNTEDFTLAGEYVEVESGKGADALERRPKLAAAIKAAKKVKGPVRCRLSSKPTPKPRRKFHLRLD